MGNVGNELNTEGLEAGRHKRPIFCIISGEWPDFLGDSKIKSNHELKHLKRFL